MPSEYSLGLFFDAAARATWRMASAPAALPAATLTDFAAHGQEIKIVFPLRLVAPLAIPQPERQDLSVRRQTIRRALFGKPPELTHWADAALPHFSGHHHEAFDYFHFLTRRSAPSSVITIPISAIRDAMRSSSFIEISSIVKLLVMIVGSMSR